MTPIRLSELATVVPLADKTTTIYIIVGLLIALLVIGLVIYISYRSTLDDDSRGTEP